MKKYNLKNDKIGIIIQARCGSKRYPAKIEKKILYNDTELILLSKDYQNILMKTQLF